MTYYMCFIQTLIIRFIIYKLHPLKSLAILIIGFTFINYNLLKVLRLLFNLYGSSNVKGNDEN